MSEFKPGDISDINSLLRYDEMSGLLFWKVDRRGGCRAGDVAGTRHRSGYVQVNIKRRLYMAHRVAWLIVYGRWPHSQIDHINGVRDDNRLSNLREATPSENGQNLRAGKGGSTSNFLGVCWNSARGKWNASITINGKQKNLGNFDSEKAAYSAYLKEKAKRHPFGTICEKEN